MNVLMWFRRDLRIPDNAALAQALARGPVLPVFVADPQDWQQPDCAARHWAFVSECLADLRDDLAALGLPLVLRTGETVAVLDRLCRTYGIAEILSTARPEGDWAQMRDRRVQDWARSTGILWRQMPEGAAPDLPPVRTVASVEPGPLPNARALGLRDDPCPHRQRGGRAAGLALLGSFLATRAAGYRAAQTAPLLAERGSSRLSPYLAHGALSRAEVDQAVAVRLAERPGPEWSAGLQRFRSRLTLSGPAALLTPGVSDGSTRLDAWQAGETGLPFLDACLRQLRATGWLNDRLRQMVARSAVGMLGLPVTTAGTALARLLTDHDPTILWPEMARLADPAAMRLDNPVQLGAQLDPTGAFTRRWLPELQPVPDECLQAPWRWSGAPGLLGRRYPEPVVDPVSALRAARLNIRPTQRPPRSQPRLTIDLIEPCPQPPRRPNSRQLSFDL